MIMMMNFILFTSVFVRRIYYGDLTNQSVNEVVDEFERMHEVF